MAKSIERLGFMRVGYSGFYFDIDTEPDHIDSKSYYYVKSLVLGWWVYQWREWHIEG